MDDPHRREIALRFEDYMKACVCGRCDIGYLFPPHGQMIDSFDLHTLKRNGPEDPRLNEMVEDEEHIHCPACNVEILFRDQFWIREVIDGHEEEQARKYIEEFGEQRCPYCGQEMDPIFDSEHKLHGFDCPDYCTE